MKLLKAAAFYINRVEIKLLIFIAKRWLFCGDGGGGTTYHTGYTPRENWCPPQVVVGLLIDRYGG